MMQQRDKTSRATVLGMLLIAIACHKPPQLSLRGYYFVGTPDEANAQNQNRAIIAAAETIIHAIIAEDREKLLEFVHRKEGAIIDAKEFVSYDQIKAALYNPTANLHRVLWDDRYWKELAPHDNIRSYRSVFSRAGEIQLGLYWYSAYECEVRLDFKNRPSMGLMGNLVFRKLDGRWYLANFF